MPPPDGDERATLTGWPASTAPHSSVGVARTNTADRALDATSPFLGADVTLRWILIHMTAEYARYIGPVD